MQQQKMVALWKSLVTWKEAQYLSDVTGSPTVNGLMEVKSVTCGRFVDTVR